MNGLIKLRCDKIGRAGNSLIRFSNRAVLYAFAGIIYIYMLFYQRSNRVSRLFKIVKKKKINNRNSNKTISNSARKNIQIQRKIFILEAHRSSKFTLLVYQITSREGITSPSLTVYTLYGTRRNNFLTLHRPLARRLNFYRGVVHYDRHFLSRFEE